MAVFIASQTIGSAKEQLAVNHAIQEAIGDREGIWRVSIIKSLDHHAWTVAVKGPKGFHWTERFEAKECTPQHIGASVRANLERADKDLLRHPAISHPAP